MDGFVFGFLLILGMAAVPVGVAVAVLREGAQATRRHAWFATLAERCGLSPHGAAPGELPDHPTMPFGSPVQFAGERGGVRVGARRVNGPPDDPGFGVQVWAEVPDLGFVLSTSALSASGGPKVNLADPRFTRALYLSGSGIAARATLDHRVRDALLPLLAAGRLGLGEGRVVAVTREAEPVDARELGLWMDEVIVAARAIAAATSRPLAERLAHVARLDPFPQVRWDAAEALLTLGPGGTEALASLRDAADVQVAVLAELAAGDAAAVAARAAAAPEVAQRVLDTLEAASHGNGPTALVARLREPLGPLGGWLVERVRIGGSRGREASALLARLGGFDEVPGLSAIAGDAELSFEIRTSAEAALEPIRARLRPLAGRLSTVTEGGELTLVDEPERRGRVDVVK